MQYLDPLVPAAHRCRLRVDGTIDSLARMMVAVSVALSGTWVQREDRERGAHYALDGSPLDVIARADLAPSAIELELVGFGDAAPVIAELARRLQSRSAGPS
jgi:hypothetical protein